MFYEVKIYEYWSLEVWAMERERNDKRERSYFFRNHEEASQFLMKQTMEEMKIKNFMSISFDKKTLSSCSFIEEKNMYRHLFVELSERHFER